MRFEEVAASSRVAVFAILSIGCDLRFIEVFRGISLGLLIMFSSHTQVITACECVKTT
jgi:hypothetical protein